MSLTAQSVKNTRIISPAWSLQVPKLRKAGGRVVQRCVRGEHGLQSGGALEKAERLAACGCRKTCGRGDKWTQILGIGYSIRRLALWQGSPGCPLNGRILLANQLQSSGSTFSCVSFPSFFAFQEGMWDTQISALPSSPTVSGPLFELGVSAKAGLETLVERPVRIF